MPAALFGGTGPCEPPLDGQQRPDGDGHRDGADQGARERLDLGGGGAQQQVRGGVAECGQQSPEQAHVASDAATSARRHGCQDTL
jgi:hypothetical protein